MNIQQPRRTDAYRYSWETWVQDDAYIVGLLDHHLTDQSDGSRPMMVVKSGRDAEILLTVVRVLDVVTVDGLPHYPNPQKPS